jgi:mRNA interferase HigB
MLVPEIRSGRVAQLAWHLGTSYYRRPMSAKKKPGKPEKSSQKRNSALALPQIQRQGGMRIIAVATLREFWKNHADAEQPLRSWYKEATDTRWHGPNDIKQRYPSADILPNNRVVFNIKGNTYRLIVKIHFNTGIVFIRFVGTHADYDKINAETI